MICGSLRRMMLARSSFAAVRASSPRVRSPAGSRTSAGSVRCSRDRSEQQQQDQQRGRDRRHWPRAGRPGRRRAAPPRRGRARRDKERTAVARAAAPGKPRSPAEPDEPSRAEPPQQGLLESRRAQMRLEGAADRIPPPGSPNQPPTGLRKVWRKVVNHDEESENACLSLKAEASRPEAFGRAERAIRNQVWVETPIWPTHGPADVLDAAGSNLQRKQAFSEG